MKIIIIGGVAQSLINFRGDLIKSFLNANYDVVCISGETDHKYVEQLEKLGCKFIPCKLKRTSLNPLADLLLLFNFIMIFRQEKPDVILAYTIKPVVWGGIASKLFSRTKFYGLITGLGFSFQKGSLKRNILCSLVKRLYKFALSGASGVIFQNSDNQNVFIKNRLINREVSTVVPGSGVNLSHFAQTPLPKGKITFLMISRLLGEKGVREYIEAAKQIRTRYQNVSFHLVGPIDSSPDGIPQNEVLEWQESRYIEYFGSSSDVRPFIEACHVFVLPSYHEGMPRTVLEAMSMARPILTTEVPGCKDTVTPGVNGFLVQHGRADLLAERVGWFIDNEESLQEMGQKSRCMAEDIFDVRKINASLFDIMSLKRNFNDKKTI
ncbi:glycosyltransferase family 4 protein [Shewanella woodyi]|uniref:Glycosyl transferase group 1 n=1 Tax=Shewanella woodyi (strain ATCC 51908 / MS32) TaxID=392500 RepID=B1KMF1_SHEWM|nr:glycosyltransferase family 4 protein [Shewanella woodyi]ACA85949.1 glycosyl transferase group 1 [Shewanella woodyi ATCC 51908]